MPDRDNPITRETPKTKEGGYTLRMQEELKLIAEYDAVQNEYTLHRHNLTPEQANEAVRELSARFSGLLIVGQRRKHATTDPGECRTCRRDVQRQAHIEPVPKFKRRQV